MAMKQLTEQQKFCTDFPFDRDLIVQGVAGSGKSLVLLGRALKISRQARAQGERFRIGLFTFAKTLVHFMKESLEAEDEDLGGDISVGTLDSHIQQVYRQVTGRNPQNVYKNSLHADCLREVLRRDFADDEKHGRILSEERRRWLLDELAWIKQHRYEEEQEYVGCVRRGRGRIPLRKEDRPFVYAIYKAYYAELTRQNITTIDMMCEAILRNPKKIPESLRFDMVLIDEAQDLPVNKLLVAVACTRVAMTISADFAQKIYGSSFTWKEIGLDVKGKGAQRLKGTHRNTVQIANLADSLLRHYSDTSEDEEILERDRPVREGPLPRLLYCRSSADMNHSVIGLVKKITGDSPESTVGILIRENTGLTAMENELRRAGIAFENVRKNENAKLLTPGVKLVTCHSAKGLEFDQVILPIAGVILAIVMTMELLQLVMEKNNMHDFETWVFFKWMFKTFCAVMIVTNTWDIVMGVFDLAQGVVNAAAGVISSDTSLELGEVVANLEARLMEMEIGPLLGLWFQSLFVGVTMNALTICIFVVIYGRMVEIYTVTSLAPLPMATMMNREWGQMGQNYLRSLFALGFQAFLIIVCVAIYAVLVRSIATDGDVASAIWTCIGYTVLLCFTLFKSGSVAKGIFGAH